MKYKIDSFDLFLLLSLYLLFTNCKSKESTSKEFEIEEGFESQLIAKEPLIKDPVDMEFDSKGDAYVLEMPGYPMEDAQSRIVKLRDTDEDGIYDESKLFAEHLQMATSILSYKAGFLVAAPPYLLYVKDENQDGISESRDTLMGGFSTGNLQHNYNGLTFGLDGWIYAANGGNSGIPFWWNDTTSRVPLRGNDIRFNIEQRKLERIGRSSGGFGLAIDEYGRVFETHNTDHISQLVFSEKYIGTNKLTIRNALKNISDHDEGELARIYPIGEQESRVNHPEQSGYFSGACGITYCSGDNYGPSFKNTVWVCDVVLNLIHIDRPVKKGSYFSAKRLFERKDFLASTDRAFRPVNMIQGPDGNMYVLDMHRKVIEHPEWIPDEMEKDMDLNHGKDQGRIYRISKSNIGFKKWATPHTTVEWIESLQNDNQWSRMNAHRQLMQTELSQEDIVLLKKQAESKSLARLHAAWILNEQKAITNAEILKLLNDLDPGIRENALRIAENYLDQTEIVEAILEKVLDGDQRVRMQAALSLSLISKEKFNAYKEKIIEASIKALDLSCDEYNIAALTLANKYDPASLFTSLLTIDSDKNENILKSLAANASMNNEDLAKLFSALTTVAHDTSVLISEILHTISSQVKDIDGKAILPFILKLESDADVPTILACNDLRKKLDLTSSSAYKNLSVKAISVLQVETVSESKIIENIQLVSAQPFDTIASLLFSFLDTKRSQKVQDAVIQVFNDHRPPALGKEIVKRWANLGPYVRAKAGDLLLYHQPYQKDLLTGLETKKINIGEMNFDLERRRTLLWWSGDEDVKKRAASLFSDAGVETRKEAIDKMRPALTLPSDVKNGRMVFSKICAPCHVYGTIGNAVGPTLTEISRKSKETLLQDILDPNAAANTQYISHKIETIKNEILIGIVEKESDEEVVIKKMGGEVVNILKKDIKSFTSLGNSLMMEGLESSMSVQEMADLLGYLQNGR